MHNFACVPLDSLRNCPRVFRPNRDTPHLLLWSLRSALGKELFSCIWSIQEGRNLYRDIYFCPLVCLTNLLLHMAKSLTFVFLAGIWCIFASMPVPLEQHSIWHIEPQVGFSGFSNPAADTPRNANQRASFDNDHCSTPALRRFAWLPLPSIWCNTRGQVIFFPRIAVLLRRTYCDCASVHTLNTRLRRHSWSNASGTWIVARRLRCCTMSRARSPDSTMTTIIITYKDQLAWVPLRRQHASWMHHGSEVIF